MTGTVGQMSSVKDFVENTFDGSVLKDEHERQVTYHIPTQTTTLSFMFQSMERAREECGIEDYSINPTSLKQIFAEFSGRTDASALSALNDVDVSELSKVRN